MDSDEGYASMEGVAITVMEAYEPLGVWYNKDGLLSKRVRKRGGTDGESSENSSTEQRGVGKENVEWKSPGEEKVGTDV